MTQEQYKELLRSQQGELDAVLMYKRLAKVDSVQISKFRTRKIGHFNKREKERL